MGRPRHGNLHTHGPRNPPGSPTTPGQGAAGQPRLPARHSSESRGDKSGRATSGEPPLGSSPRETDGEPLPRAQLLLRHPVPQQSVSRASSTSLFLRPRPDNRANSVSGDRGAPAWQQGSPGLSQLSRSRSPSGGRGSRPRPARVGAPPRPTCSRPRAGQRGPSRGLGLRPAAARRQPHLCSAPAHPRTPARTPSPGCGWPAADPARSRPWLPAPRSAGAPGGAGSRPAH